MPELIGYDENGNPQFSFSDEDKLKGISVRQHNALLDSAPVEAEQAPLPVDVTGVGGVPTNTTGFVAADKLFGLNGQERFQTWPERMVRSGVGLAHDVMTGELPVTTLRREDVTDIPAPQGATADSPFIGRLLNLSPVAADPRDPLIERAQDMAGLAGGATLGINPAEMTVASGMTKMAKNGAKLTPVEGNPFNKILNNQRQLEGYQAAFRDPVTYKIYSADITHPDLIDYLPNKTVKNRFEEEYAKDLDIGSNHFGFVDENGKFVSRSQLEKKFRIGTSQDLERLKAEGIIKSKTAMFRSDTQKPGMALSALEKPAPVFYSALENAVNNITANKMPADQWLGTLTNAKGVRPEEMEWTGLKDFLAEQKGPVTKDQVQQYLDANKVELKEVNKGIAPDAEAAVKALAESHGNKWNELSQVDRERYIRTADGRRLTDYGVDPKFSKYQLPGGENYRETLLTLPDYKNSLKYKKALELSTKMSNGDFVNLSSIEHSKIENEINNLIQTAKDKFPDFKSSHWDEPNVLAHVRMNDRTMPLEFTAEEKTALQAHEDAQPALDNILKKQRKVALEIQDTAKPLEAARRAKIIADNKAGKLSNVEAMRQLENYESPAELKPLQDKLTDLRAQEDKLRASLPEKPVQKNLKSLHLEEIQSDWHQIARDKGYAVSADKIEKLRPQFEKIDNKLLNSNDEQLLGHPEVDGMLKMAVDKKIITPDEAKIYKQVSDTAQTGAVPDAPFKKTWHELVLKRMLREAAEKGYQRLSWTPGEAQAARYDLSKEIDRLSYNPKTEKLYAYKGDSAILDGETVPKDKIADYVGKGVAQRLLESKLSSVSNAGVPIHSLEGESLKINPEEARGMNTFYNMIIPKALEKIGKEHGVKVKQGFGGRGKIQQIVNPSGWQALGPKNEFIGNYKSKEDAIKAIKQPVHYIDIPQSLKDQALRKGFPLFSSGVMLSPVEQSPFDNQPKLTRVPHNPFEQEK